MTTTFLIWLIWFVVAALIFVISMIILHRSPARDDSDWDFIFSVGLAVTWPVYPLAGVIMALWTGLYLMWSAVVHVSKSVMSAVWKRS